MKLKCIAVDDEPLALSLIAEYIRRVPFLELVAVCGDAFDAARALKNEDIDLMFTDIQMPGLTGLQFVNSLVKRPLVVFVTAYKKYALDGFELDVLDYLVKPVGMDRFLKTCNKAYDLCLLRTGATPAVNDFFFVKVDYSLIKVLFEEVVWVEVSGDYVKINLKNAPRPLLVRMTARTLEAELPAERFVRIHKSYIVSLSFISAVRKNSVFIGDMELPVGETYRDALRRITKREL